MKEHPRGYILGAQPCNSNSPSEHGLRRADPGGHHLLIRDIGIVLLGNECLSSAARDRHLGAEIMHGARVFTFQHYCVGQVARGPV